MVVINIIFGHYFLSYQEKEFTNYTLLSLSLIQRIF